MLKWRKIAIFRDSFWRNCFEEVMKRRLGSSEMVSKHSLIHSLATLWDERKVQQLHHDSERTMAMLTLHKRIKDLKNFFGNLLNGFTFIWRKKFFGWICEDRTSRFLSKEFQEYIKIATLMCGIFKRIITSLSIFGIICKRNKIVVGAWMKLE